jgi:hypothetical protein
MFLYNFRSNIFCFEKYLASYAQLTVELGVYACPLSDFNNKFRMCWQIVAELPSTKFDENPSSGSPIVTCWPADRHGGVNMRNLQLFVQKARRKRRWKNSVHWNLDGARSRFAVATHNALSRYSLFCSARLCSVRCQDHSIQSRDEFVQWVSSKSRFVVVCSVNVLLFPFAGDGGLNSVHISLGLCVRSNVHWLENEVSDRRLAELLNKLIIIELYACKREVQCCQPTLTFPTESR